MPKFLFPLLILSLIACCIELDISVPGFSAMARHFNVPEGIIQLSIAYNFLGFCIASLFYGPLSDCYGRRKVMTIGNFILLIGALGCTFACSIEWLLFARFVQGASTSAVVVFAMIADIRLNDGNGIKYIAGINSILTVLIA